MKASVKQLDDELKTQLTNEVTVPIGNTSISFFLQNGAYEPKAITNGVHLHRHAEIHLVAGGPVEYQVGESHINCVPGDLLAVPAGVYHDALICDADTRRMIFMTSLPIAETQHKHISVATVENLLAETALAYKTKNHNRLVLHLALLCTELHEFTPSKVVPIRDEGYIISEFLNRCADKELSLSGLAQLLCVSEKQAERLILKHTGLPYKKAVIRRRREIANWLIENTDLPLTEIAARVGYKSYSGFYKACLRYD